MLLGTIARRYFSARRPKAWVPATYLSPQRAFRETALMAVLVVLGWCLLVALTVGPIFSAQKHEPDPGWTWILAALLFGPLAGVFYYMSRHAMKKVDSRYQPKHAQP